MSRFPALRAPRAERLSRIIINVNGGAKRTKGVFCMTYHPFLRLLCLKARRVRHGYFPGEAFGLYLHSYTASVPNLLLHRECPSYINSATVIFPKGFLLKPLETLSSTTVASSYVRSYSSTVDCVLVALFQLFRIRIITDIYGDGSSYTEAACTVLHIIITWEEVFCVRLL